MNFITKITNFFKRSTTTSSVDTGTTSPAVSNIEDYTQFFIGSGSSLNVATAYACARFLSESVANLSMVYQKKQGGIFKADEASILNYLLNIQPSAHINAFDFWSCIIRQKLLRGNAYILPMYDYNLELYALVLLTPGTVSHDTTNHTYTISDSFNGIYGTFAESDVIHIKGMSIDGGDGMSVVSYAKTTLAIAETGDNETLNRFKTGGNVIGLVTNDNSNVKGFGEVQDKELNKTAVNLDTRFRSGERIVNLPGEADFKQISLSSTDMQFLESRKFTVRDICRFFGVHPSFVFDDTSNNYKDAEEAWSAYLSNTLGPMLKQIETEFSRKLISPKLYAKYKFQFNREDLFSSDLVSRIEYQTKTIAAGLYTVNEWRLKENKEGIEGGDKVLVSANLKGINELTTNSNNGEK